MSLKKENDIAVSFVADKNYLVQFAVSALSFLSHHPNDQWSIYLFSNDIVEGDLESLRQLIEVKHQNGKIELVQVDPEAFEQFHGFWENHGRQVFYRFVIPQFIPAKFKYILYMDVDVVVKGVFDFNDLVPKNGKPISAVKDFISHILAPKRGLTKYFNSGFLVIDREYWLEHKITNHLFKIEPPIRRFADQDILNELFKENWNEISNVYNYPASKLRLSINGYSTNDGLRPKLIHFNGGIKPWDFWQKGSWQYWKYVLKSPFTKSMNEMPLTIIKSIIHKASKIKITL